REAVLLLHVGRALGVGARRLGDGDLLPRLRARPLRLDLSVFFSSRRRHTRSVSAFLLNRSSDLGTANGRLHFHAVHFMRTLPTGSVDPNFGRRVRNRRQLNSLQNTWPYGYSMPIAVRYTQDAFSRSGWLWPVDA